MTDTDMFGLTTADREQIKQQLSRGRKMTVDEIINPRTAILPPTLAEEESEIEKFTQTPSEELTEPYQMEMRIKILENRVEIIEERLRIYFPKADHRVFPMLYLQTIEGMRSDVLLGRKYGFLNVTELETQVPGLVERYTDKLVFSSGGSEQVFWMKTEDIA